MYLTNIERGLKRFIYGTLPFGYLAVFKKTSPELKYRRYFMKHGYSCNQFAICTYHRKNDAKAITNYLREHNCTWSVPEDLFYVKHAFRTCLVRGQK